MTTITTTTTDAMRVGQIVEGNGARMRVTAINGSTFTVRLLFRYRVWLWLTTAPNGDSTRWMVGS